MKIWIRFFIVSLLASSILFSGSASTAQAAITNTVSTQIPQFAVSVNGMRIYSPASPYPLLFYKDITYFPMTWDYCQSLGLTTAWSQDGGFEIQSSGTGMTEMKQDLSGNNPSNGSFPALLPSYQIKVNGEIIDNSAEDYPILNFRDITYFPMTWRFAHDAFNLTIDFSTGGGLDIKREGAPMSPRPSKY
jgi:hypothetical protein